MSNTIATPSKEQGNINEDYEVFTGSNFDGFTHSLPSDMKDAEILNIRNSTIEILRKCVPPSFKNDTPVSNTGLVMGYVQSGKTMSFTALIALASDNNYKLIVVLAGTTRILLEQTVDRLSSDLNDHNSYVILSEDNPLYSDSRKIAKIIQNPKRKRTVIIPILKHHVHIKKINQLLSEDALHDVLLTNSVLIIDDEADQASLNGLARKKWRMDQNIASLSKMEKNEVKKLKDFTTTYGNLIALKNQITCHSYVQYTATPQANVLAAQRDLLRPSWCVVLEPGDKYTGGKIFFNESLRLIKEIDSEIEEEDPDMPEELGEAFRLFLIESALLCYDYKETDRLLSKMKRTSMMVHADRLIETNSTYMRWLKGLSAQILADIENMEQESMRSLQKSFVIVKSMLDKYFSDFPTFEDVLEKLQYFVLDDLRFWFVAGDGDKQVIWKCANHHVLVGGQKLDRGFTVNELITTYLPRTTKAISNADTIEQRCRFFGYKKDYLDACRVFLPQESIDEFCEYVAHEEKLRDMLKNGDIQDYYNNNKLMRLVGLNPSSLGKIPANIIRNNYYNYKFLQPDLTNKAANDQLVDLFIKGTRERGELSYSSSNNKLSDDNHHFVRESDVNKLKLFLKNIQVTRTKDRMLLDQFIALLEDIKTNTKVWLLEMAYKRDFRPRSLKETGELKALFTNHPPEFGDTRLLTTEMASGKFYGKYNNEVIVQIHKVKIKEIKYETSKYQEYGGQIFNVIAFRYPNEDSSNFIQFDYD